MKETCEGKLEGGKISVQMREVTRRINNKSKKQRKAEAGGVGIGNGEFKHFQQLSTSIRDTARHYQNCRERIYHIHLNPELHL